MEDNDVTLKERVDAHEAHVPFCLNEEAVRFIHQPLTSLPHSTQRCIPYSKLQTWTSLICKYIYIYICTKGILNKPDDLILIKKTKRL